MLTDTGDPPGGVLPPPMYSSRLGEPAPSPESFHALALPRMALPTVAGAADGLPCRYSAAAPATCGLAMEVPSMVLVPPYSHALVMYSPGAYRSTQLPQLLNQVSW